MAKQIRTDLDFLGISKIINLPNPVNNQDAVPKIYVDQLIEGLNWKDNVRAASAGNNVNISSPGTTLDGVTLANGDRILLKDQTNQAENGLYIFNGATSPLTRTLDANTPTELRNAVVVVDEGTQAGTSWRQTALVNTLGTDNVIWQPFVQAAPPSSETTAGSIRIVTQAETDAGVIDNAAITPLKLANWSGRLRKYSATIGDATNTIYTVTHNLNTRDLHVSVYNNSGNYDDVEVEVRRPSVNSVEIRTSAAPGSNSLQVVIIG